MDIWCFLDTNMYSTITANIAAIAIVAIQILEMLLPQFFYIQELLLEYLTSALGAPEIVLRNYYAK